jgi:hypothetical protein
MADLLPEPGSLRDPSSRVFYDGDTVLRALDERALAEWHVLRDSDLFAAAVADGRIVGTEELEEPGSRAGLLRHERIPFVSYPYEWTFSMLRDAALLTLDLLSRALAEDLILKDATPFNIQYRGAQPVFIDIGSFQRLTPGEPWVGYGQFCRQFLFPLMLTAYKGVGFQPWLRGEIEGPKAADMRSLMSKRDLGRPGVLTHVSLQARVERRYQDEAVDMRSELAEAGFKKELIEANVNRLRKLVGGMEPRRGTSAWSGYAAEHQHVARDRDAKTQFLAVTIDQLRPGRVADLGANDGHFARTAAPSAAVVVAVDSDEAVLDGLYRDLSASGDAVINVALADVTNPTPALGWRGRERQSLSARLRPDLVVAYGLIHHLVLGQSIPLAEVVDWLADFGCAVVLEFVSAQDPLARRVAINKRTEELHAGYDRAELERLFATSFSVVRRREIGDGLRVLYDLRPL